MRYPASEKLEIIRIVERSHLPAKQTLDRLGIARPTFYRLCVSLCPRHSSMLAMICISGSAKRRWKIGVQDPSVHGTGYRRRCRTRSWIWRWNAASYRPGS